MARSKKARTFRPQKASISFDSNIARKLEEHEAKFLDEGLRRVAYSGAKVLYDELLLRTPVDETNSDKAPLKAAIYHWHDDKRSTRRKQSYAIGVNKAKAPHWFVVEYGHWRYYPIGLVNGKWKTFTNRPLAVPVWVPPNPYLRPAFESKMGAALQASVDRFHDIANRIFRGQPVA